MAITINGLSTSHVSIEQALATIRGGANILTEDKTISTDNTTDPGFSIGDVRTNGHLLKIVSTANTSIDCSSGNGIKSDDSDVDDYHVEGFVINNTNSFDSLVFRNISGDVTIVNITIVSTNSNRPVFSTACGNININGLIIVQDGNANGVEIKTSTGIVSINNLQLQKSNSTNKDGIYFETNQDVSITNSVISGASRHGIYGLNNVSLKSKRNRVFNCGNHGILNNETVTGTLSLFELINTVIYNTSTITAAEIVLSKADTNRAYFNTIICENSGRNSLKFSDIDSVTIIGNLFYNNEVDSAGSSFIFVEFNSGNTLSDYNSDYNGFYKSNPAHSYRIANGTVGGANLFADSVYDYNTGFSTYINNNQKDLSSIYDVDPLFVDFANDNFQLTTLSTYKDIYDDTNTLYSEGLDVRSYNRQQFYISIGAYDPDADAFSVPSNDSVIETQGINVYFTHKGVKLKTDSRTTIQSVFNLVGSGNYIATPENSPVVPSKYSGVFILGVGTVTLPGFYGTIKANSEYYFNAYDNNVVFVDIGSGANIQYLLLDITDLNGSNGYLLSSISTSIEIYNVSSYDYMISGSVDTSNIGQYNNGSPIGFYPSESPMIDYDHKLLVNHLGDLGNLFHISPKKGKGIIEFGLDDDDYQGNLFSANEYALISGHATSSGYGVWITGPSNFVFRRCWFESLTYAVRVGPDTDTKSMMFVDCVMADSRNGISIESCDAMSFVNCKLINNQIPIYAVYSQNLLFDDITISYDQTTTYASSQSDPVAYISGKTSLLRITAQVIECQNISFDRCDFSYSSYFGTYSLSTMTEIIKISSGKDISITRCRFDGGYSSRYIWTVASETADYGALRMIIHSNIFMPLNHLAINHGTEMVTFYQTDDIKVYNNYFYFLQSSSSSLVSSDGDVRNILVHGTKDSTNARIFNNYFRVEIAGNGGETFPIPSQNNSAYYIKWTDSESTVIDIGSNVYEGNGDFAGLISVSSNCVLNGSVATVRALDFVNGSDGDQPTDLVIINDFTPSSHIVVDNGGKINDSNGALFSPLLDIATYINSGVLIGNGDNSETILENDYRNYSVVLSSFDIGPVQNSGTPYVPPALSGNLTLKFDFDVDSSLDQSPHNQIFPTGIVKPTLANVDYTTGKYLVPELEEFNIISGAVGDYDYVIITIKDSSTGEIVSRDLAVDKVSSFDSGTQSDSHVIRVFDVLLEVLGDGSYFSQERQEYLTVVQSRPLVRMSIDNPYVYGSLTGSNTVTLYNESSYYDSLQWTVELDSGLTQNYITETVGPLIYIQQAEREVSLEVTNTTDVKNVLISNYIKVLPDPDAPIVDFTVDKWNVHLGDSVELRNKSLFASSSNYSIRWYVFNERPSVSNVSSTSYNQDNWADGLTSDTITLNITEYGEYTVVLEYVDSSSSDVMTRKQIKRCFSVVPSKSQGTVHVLNINSYVSVDGDPTYEAIQIGADTGVEPSHFGGVDPGDVIIIRGGIYTNIYFKDFVGTEDQPILITNQTGERVIVDRSNDPNENSAGISFRNCEHVYLVGDIYESETSTVIASHKNWRTDIRPVKDAGGNNVSDTYFGICVRYGNSRGVRAEKASTDIFISGVEISEQSFAGIMVKQDPSGDEPQYWDQYYRFYNLRILRTVIHHTHGEGMYLGFSAWYIKEKNATQTSTVSVRVRRNVASGLPYSKGDNVNVSIVSGTEIKNKPHSLISTIVSHNQMRDTGWDGFQIGCGIYGTEIHDNVIENSGTENVFGQNSMVSLNLCNGDFYNNILNEGTAGNALAVFGKTRVYNNTFSNMDDSGRIFYLHYGDDKLEYRQLVKGLLTTSSGYTQNFLDSFSSDPDIIDKSTAIEIFNNSALTGNAPIAINPKGEDISETIDHIWMFNNLFQLAPIVFVDPNAVSVTYDNIKQGRLFYMYGFKTGDGSALDNSSSIPNYDNSDQGGEGWEYWMNGWFTQYDIDNNTSSNPRFVNPYNGDLTLLPGSPFFDGGVSPLIKDVDIDINFGIEGFNRNLENNVSYGAFAGNDWTTEDLVITSIPDVSTDCETCFNTFFPSQSLIPNNSTFVRYIIWSVTSSHWIEDVVNNVSDINPNVAPDGSLDDVDSKSVVILTDSSRNDPPLTVTSKGQKGEIRYDSNHIYICVEKNFWIKTKIVGE